MKEYKPKYQHGEEVTGKGGNLRTRKTRRLINKSFRQTARDLLQYDIDTIFVPSYKKRSGDSL